MAATAVRGRWHRRATGVYVRKRGTIYDRVERRGTLWYVSVGSHRGTTPFPTRIAATSSLDSWILSQRTENQSAPKQVETQKCDGCNGSGKYYGHGYVENGVFKGHIGKCFRCEGKGHQTDADRVRNRNYDQYVRRIPA